MESFVVEGGAPIGGEIVPAGNKNEALPCLAACLLSDESVTLRNLPAVSDVATQIDLLEALGCEVARSDPHTVTVGSPSDGSPLRDEARQIRGSFLLAGPLLVRRGEVRLPAPGGDRIGRRRLDTHLLAFRELGATCEVSDGEYVLRASDGLTGADVFLDEASVMGTENAIMAAVLARGTTRVANAASEPHVQGLCRMLVGMGAEVEGIGTNHLVIEGVDALGEGDHRIGPDHIEVGSFLGLAAATGGDLTIRDAGVAHLPMIRLGFERLGVELEFDGEDVRLRGDQSRAIVDDSDGAIPKLDDAPWPGFPADLISIMIVLATQSSGTILIHEKMFESRMFFVDQLQRMGSRIVLCDPHRVIVDGPTPLIGQRISSPDIRAGMALVIAALTARGESVINNVSQIDRGYEQIETRLRSLGARIERVRG